MRLYAEDGEHQEGVEAKATTHILDSETLGSVRVEGFANLLDVGSSQGELDENITDKIEHDSNVSSTGINTVSRNW